MIQKEAWSFYRTISGVRLCWELEKPEGSKGVRLNDLEGGPTQRAGGVLAYSSQNGECHDICRGTSPIRKRPPP